MTWGVEAATVTFGAATAVEGVDLEAETGAVVVVVGGDGAGKSTLLRALVGLVGLSSGSVRRPAKEHLGYVPATAGIYVDLTVGENLDFAAHAYGLDARTRRDRADRLLSRIGLGEARGRLGGQLSGGMQRKLALAMAVMHRPRLLVLDEPTTGVDPVSRAELWRLVSGEAVDGTAVVVATTYVDEAVRGSTVLLLEGGRVIARGAPEAVVAAVPGRVGLVRGADRPSGPAWRQGATWKVWAADGPLPAGAEPVEPTFDDAVMVAALARRRER